jgi:hypothetical protein
MDDDSRPGPDADDQLAELARIVETLRIECDEDRALLEELHLAMAAGTRRSPVTRAYPDWISWVDRWLGVRISRSPQRHRWCHHYAEHPEVADRLEALWYAWETAWPDPTARLAWFRDGLDHQLPIITADDGPLRDCSAPENQHLLPAALAPPGPDDPAHR